jgi:hypothetical protein
MRSLMVLAAAAALLVMGGCDVVDPARPTAQPDTEVFGNLLDVERPPGDPGAWIVRVQVAAPRSVRAADEDTGKPTPEIEKGMVATVTVGADTVVVVDDRPGLLENIASGTEIVVLPIAGTTEMYGSNDLRLAASTVMDFATYRRWRLPMLEAAADTETDDPALINSAGPEIAAVPIAGGTVLYFSAHLRPPATADDAWHGALRDGLAIPEEGVGAVERSYRSELTEEGWTAPELVRFPGLEDARQVRVTWVSADETISLLTVTTSGEAAWVGRSTRSGAKARWSAPQRLEVLGDDARDAVYLTGSSTKILFATSRGGGMQGDLFLYDPKVGEVPAPLQPPIFSPSNEWSPRTGPDGELLFNRGSRQLVLKGGQVGELRLPGPHRIPFTQAATTEDGRWLFFCMPKYRVPEMDEDIFVASLTADFKLGEPVPVDEWRP